MQHASDPVLASMANRLNDITFTVEDFHQERYNDLLRASAEGSFRNVIARCYGKSWGVRLYLGGKQRCIGYSKKHMDALRFADMALMHFWVYRTRNANEPVDSDLNFGLESVKRDQEECEPAMELLRLVEDHLIFTKVFAAPVRTEEERQAARNERNKRRTVRGDLDNIRDGISFELDKLASLQALTRDEVTQLKATFKRIEDSLALVLDNQKDLVNSLSKLKQN